MTKKNRGWLIVVYAIVALIIVATIVSCIVKVNKKPDIQEPHAYAISIENQANYNLCDKDTDKEKYDEINKVFLSSFEENLLTSLFSGRLFYNSRIDSLKPSTFSGYKLKLIYAQDQTIKLNGKAYNPPTNSSETITYREILIDVQENQGYTTHYIYYPYEYTDTNSIVKTGYYRQTIMANFDELYKALAEF